MKTIMLSSWCIYLFLTCSCTGQSLKKPLLEEDYKLWSTLEPEKISDSGNWISYLLQYQSGKDTLFVKNTKNLKTFTITKGFNGQFANESYFVCQNDKEQLVCTKLSKGKQVIIEKVIEYKLNNEGRYLIALKRANDEKQELLIKDLETGADKTITNVTNFSFNPKANVLICDSNKKPTLIDLNKELKIKTIKNTTESNYSDFVWQKEGESVAFLSSDKDTKIVYYQLKEGKLYIFDPLFFDHFPKDVNITNSAFTALTISDDGTKVFFGSKEKEAEKKEKGIQIWNTVDKVLYPYKQIINDWKVMPKLAVWLPCKNEFSMLTDNNFPSAMLTNDYKCILKYNTLTHEPQFDYNAPIDFYLYNIETGKQDLILTKQSPDESKLTVSSTGKYIAYFRDKNWWVYNMNTKTHRNLTTNIGISFEQEDFDWSGELDAAGMAGWTNNDDALLIYDTYDIWLIKTDGSETKRLTQGREEKAKYRIVPQSEANASSINFNWMKKGIFQLAEGLIMQAKSDSKSGYFKWDSLNGLRQIVWSQNRISNIKVSSKSDVYAYTVEHYHQAPKLVVQFINSSNPICLYQSNPQQKKFQWGFSKLITYTNTNNEILKGALLYPADYSAEKTYPMVVQIYEKLSSNYNKYVNPTTQNSTGFNSVNFTTQGYFVLLPDIVKKEGNPGKSAVDCVLSAVREVLANEVIDPKRIGLIGHSFGGYEVNFIVTQTNKFATVVSSAGVSDIISNYLYVAWNTAKPNGFRYEFQQVKMGISPFDNYEAYYKNSPITFAKQVETPILLWSGEDDKQVHYFQSLEFHLALRRLQKPNILLLYEKEKHTISNQNNQIDLTHRIQEWFNYYLKQGNKPDWFAIDRI
jgi:dipeptidyl aminopeptidase/acylaminoacyl peptidase